MNDLSNAMRQMVKAPGFTAVALFTLTLGIGACAAIFSVVDGVLLRPLPYPEPERLVALQEINLPQFPGSFVRPGAYLEWRKQATSFEHLAAVRSRSYNLTGAGDPIRVSAARVTANTFSTFRIRPVLGRDFVAQEDVAGKGNVVIVSHGLWARQLGGRAEALHGTIQLDGQPFTIIGVMPRGFQIGGPVDVFVPAAYDEGDPQLRRSVGPGALAVFGRLKPGVTVEQARGEMTLIASRRAAADRASHGWGVKVMPLRELTIGDARPVLFLLLGAVVFLLLIACANVANLLLARATTRAREIAVRAALGASRGRIVRQLLVESIAMALVGGLLGALAAQWGVSTLIAFVPDSLPRAQEIAVDARALGFACALALMTGIAFGLAPAFAATRLPLHDTLKENTRGSGQGPRHQRLRAALVAAQVAIAVMLLAGGGLLIRSFARLQQVQRGFQPDGAVTFSVALAQSKYASNAQIAAYAERATARLAALPGVAAAGASQALPFSVDLNVIYFAIADHPPVKDPPAAYVFEVTPGYFQAMGMRLLRGRYFDAHDIEGQPRVGIINEALARKFFGDEDPIGKRMGRPDRMEAAGEVVGVVSDVRDGRVAKLDGAAPMQIYVPLAQNPYDVLSFVVRAPGRPDLPAAIRGALAEVDPDQPLGGLRPLGDWVAQSIARQRLSMVLVAVFSAAALLLAAIGIYGLMAYAVAQRTAEIGIRMALGAPPGDVIRLVMRQSARLVALGLAAGLAGALILTRFIASLLFGIGPHDPATFAAIVILLSLAAALAGFLPARRATRVDPIIALRDG
jgi:putative ABC transport system permease protein